MDGKSPLLAQNAREKWGTLRQDPSPISRRFSLPTNLESQPSKGATAGAASSVMGHGTLDAVRYSTCGISDGAV